MRVTHPLKIKKLNWGIQNFGHKKTIISMIAIKKINIKKSLKKLSLKPWYKKLQTKNNSNLKREW